MTGKELKAIRERKGLTRYELAKLLGFTAAVTIESKENGVRNITERDVKLLRAAKLMS